jgi:uncharacterized damage-inducible protein DinB
MSSAAPKSEFTKHLLLQYEIPCRMVSALADDFTEEEATSRSGDLKPLVWYLGHIATTDNYFLTLYGGHETALSDEYLARFGKGSDGHADFSDASKAELVELLATLRGKVRDVIATLEPEDFSRAPSREVQHPLFKTCGSALALIVSHCAYHAGQIANLRRSMGKDPLFG